MTQAWGSKERPWPVRVSDLDSWEYFTGAGADFMSNAEFKNRLDGTREFSAAAEIGKAFHEAIERMMIRFSDTPDAPSPLVSARLSGKGDHREIGFNLTQIDVDLSGCNFVEQDVEMVFQTASGWAQLRGVIDGLRGDVVRDLKTTKKFKAESYQDSWQWRAYLLAMGEEYRRFDYQVFTLRYGVAAERAIAAGDPAGLIDVVDFNTVTCWRYDAMESALRTVTGDLVDYFVRTGWEPPVKREMAVF